jgi:uncharacterized protein YbjT (DUF2867 family)
VTQPQHHVLAVGAGGASAGMVVPALAARGAVVRGMVRHPEQVEAVRSHGAAEVVIADLTEPESLRAALDGVDSAFYVAPAFIENEAALGQQFVREAVAAGVRRIVFLSVIHPVLRQLSNHAAKAPVEEAILDSGLEYTFLHPTLFFQGLGRSIDQVLSTGVLAEPWSADTKFSRVDFRDVAEVAARAICDDDLLYGTYDLASPGWTNRRDVAGLISEVAQRHIIAGDVDLTGARNIAPEMRTMFEHYNTHGLLSNELSLKAVLGRPPRTLRHYIEELVQAHTPS